MSNVRIINKDPVLIEIWKDIFGWKGFYQISSFGRVKSLARIIIRKNGSPLPIPEKIKRTPAPPSLPYPRVSLSRHDGNKSNNHVSNLEWLTKAEPMSHAWDMGLIRNGRTKR